MARLKPLPSHLRNLTAFQDELEVRSNLFARVPAPTGPAIERYSGAAWPGGSFATGGTP